MSDGNGLPDGWVFTEAQNICNSVRDGTHDTPQYVEEGVPLITSKNLRSSGLDFTNVKLISINDHVEISKRSGVEQGDVLFAMIGTVGNPVVVKTDREFSIKNVGLFKIDSCYLSPCYFKFWLESPQLIAWLTPKLRGSNQKFASLGLLRRLIVRLAPLAEQQRIVAKIEELFSDLDAGVTALERARANLKRYRAAVLRAAVEGRLTEQWRAENPPTEPASDLLDRILTERRQAWEAAQLATYKSKGKKPPKNWQAQYKEVEINHSEEQFSLPESWTIASMELISANEPNSICAGPFGTIFKAKDFRPEGIPIIFLRHVAPGKYLTHKPGFMDTEKWNELFQPYSVHGGELLVTKMGDPPGVCAIYPEGLGPAMVTPDVIKLTANHDCVMPAYVMHYLNSEVARRVTFGVAYGVTRPRVTLTIFRNMLLPLPPLEEQEEIVREVERRFSILDELEIQIDTSLKRAARLRQAILKRAFEGRLVPQDSRDEPASVLLERIQADRTTVQSETKSKRKPKRRLKK